MPLPSLVARTTYAELLERSANAVFKDAFADDGAFIFKDHQGTEVLVLSDKDGRDKNPTLCWSRNVGTADADRASQGDPR
jgi:hypothetical protein